MTLLRVASVETVEAPARMPAQGGASTPSRGGREGIVETGVRYIKTINRCDVRAGRFLSLVQAGKRRYGCAASPPLRI